LDELVKLITCADKMKEMAILVDEANRIANSRPITKKKLSDKYERKQFCKSSQLLQIIYAWANTL